MIRTILKTSFMRKRIISKKIISGKEFNGNGKLYAYDIFPRKNMDYNVGDIIEDEKGTYCNIIAEDLGCKDGTVYYKGIILDDSLVWYNSFNNSYLATKVEVTSKTKVYGNPIGTFHGLGED